MMILLASLQIEIISYTNYFLQCDLYAYIHHNQAFQNKRKIEATVHALRSEGQ